MPLRIDDRRDGFDRTFDLLNNSQMLDGQDNYPPYDIARTGEESYRISLAIAGFSPDDIAITALHSHMLTESPRLLFMHFWGEGDALALARGLRAALDHMNVKRS